jgi:hypothetical protein
MTLKQSPRQHRDVEEIAKERASLPSLDRVQARSPRLSIVLQQLNEHTSDRVSFYELTGIFGDQTFGDIMFIFAAPNLVPLLPGTSSVFGVPLILVAAQLALG